MRFIHSLLSLFRFFRSRTAPVPLRNIVLAGLIAPYSLLAISISVDDNTTRDIDDNSCFNTTFTVTDSFNINNTTIEIGIDHTYRDDLDIQLQSPSGTRVRLTTDNGNSADNLYVLFTDSAAISIRADYYSHTSDNIVERSPEDPLSDFAGEDSAGTWTLNICDDASRDTGRYNYAQLTLSYTQTENLREFEQRYVNNIRGNLKVIGNTILYSPLDGYNTANNHVRLKYVNESNSIPLTFNASQATINSTESGVDISNAEIIWAGLYWQGYLHSNDNDDSIDHRYWISNSQIAHDQIYAILSNHSVLLQKGNGLPQMVSPDIVNWAAQYDRSSYVAYKYGAFADVTELVKGSSPSDTYTIANIPTREGETSSGYFYDGLGNYGAWSLVVVYDNNMTAAEKTRNISIYDGYQVLNGTTTLLDINVSGFKTPKYAPAGVDSTLSFFAAEGDKYITGDYTKLINQDGYEYTLASSDGESNFFNSSIENVENRNPSLSNNMGIDIHTQPVGTSAGSDKPIRTNQTSATIEIGTHGDHFMPSMAAFATELYAPNLCYDYTVRRNDYTLTSENREINTTSNGTLSLSVLIRSMEGDFDLNASRLGIRLTPEDQVSFTEPAYYSLTGTNELIEATLTDPSMPEIAIGKDVDDNGGVIGAFERYYSKFNYAFTTGNYFNGSFEVDYRGTIDFGSGPVPIYLSTEYGTLARCEQSTIYNPVWGTFNVERIDSGDYDAASEPDRRYPLYTQLVGRDFDFSVVAYDANASPPYTEELELDRMTVEVELIDASPYDDNSSVFKCNNPDPGIVQGDSFFATFINRSRVDFNSNNDMVPDKALKNAAFRVWVLVDNPLDPNAHMLQHECQDRNSNNCWQEVYEEQLANNTYSDACDDVCSNGTGDNGSDECYSCMRNYFGQPICSRDNFSIRPESYRLKLSDSNESTDATVTAVDITDNTSEASSAPLAAEYLYRFRADSVAYNSEDVALGYYQDVYATLHFNSPSTCADTADRNASYSFENGEAYYNFKTQGTYTLSNNNVGNYLMDFNDTTWTYVDQKINPDKTFDTDDCIPNDGTTSSDSESLSGCNILSKMDESHTYLNITFMPYSFDLSSVHLDLPNSRNFLYTQNINTTNILNLRMSARLDGNITAKGKQGGTLSNFTNGCLAQPVAYDINKTITRVKNDGTVLTYADSNDSSQVNASLMDINICLNSLGQPVLLQSNYLDISGNSTYNTEDNSTSPASTLDITVATNQFLDDANGSAAIDVYYNFQRSTQRVIDPLKFTIVSQEANASTAQSWVNGNPNYIPKGSNLLNKTIDIYYGRVAATQDTPYIVQSGVDGTVVPMLVEIYCNENDINCTQHNLTSDTSFRSPNRQNWWVHIEGEHVSSEGDGIIQSLTDSTEAASATISPNSMIDLNADGNQTDINVSLSSAVPRPYRAIITIDADDWLDYVCPTDLSINPSIDFLGGGGWTGQGNTGNVINTNSYNDANNKRVDW